MDRACVVVYGVHGLYILRPGEACHPPAGVVSVPGASHIAPSCSAPSRGPVGGGPIFRPCAIPWLSASCGPRLAPEGC